MKKRSMLLHNPIFHHNVAAPISLTRLFNAEKGVDSSTRTLYFIFFLLCSTIATIIIDEYNTPVELTGVRKHTEHELISQQSTTTV